MTLLDWYS